MLDFLKTFLTDSYFRHKRSSKSLIVPKIKDDASLPIPLFFLLRQNEGWFPHSLTRSYEGKGVECGALFPKRAINFFYAFWKRRRKRRSLCPDAVGKIKEFDKPVFWFFSSTNFCFPLQKEKWQWIFDISIYYRSFLRKG